MNDEIETVPCSFSAWHCGSGDLGPGDETPSDGVLPPAAAQIESFEALTAAEFDAADWNDARDVTPPDGTARSDSAPAPEPFRIAADVTPPDGAAGPSGRHAAAGHVWPGTLVTASAPGDREALPSRRSPTVWQTRVAAVATLALLATAVVAAGAKTLGPRRDLLAPAPVAADTGESSASARFDAALVAIRAGHWDDAVRLLEESASFDPLRGETQRYLELARRERANAAVFSKARRCLGDGDGACAEGLFAAADPDSLSFEREAEALRSAIDAWAAQGGAAEADGAEHETGAGGALAVGRKGEDPRPRGETRERALGEQVRAAHRGTGRSSARRPANARTNGTTSESPAGAAPGPGEGAALVRRLVQGGVRANSGGNLELAAARFSEARAVDPTNAE
ncbi:MAG TPA: hypothetical protein VGD74_09290, partial [Vulgatibacter sp.]